MKNLLEKYLSKRNVRLLSIAMGIGAVVMIMITRFISGQIAMFNLGAIGVFGFIFLIFYIVYVLAIAVILYCTYLIYFKNKDKDTSIVVTFGINCWAAIIFLLNIQTAIFFMKIATASSLMDLIGLGNVSGAVDLFDFTLYVFIGLAIYNGYLFHKQKD